MKSQSRSIERHPYSNVRDFRPFNDIQSLGSSSAHQQSWESKEPLRSQFANHFVWREDEHHHRRSATRHDVIPFLLSEGLINLKSYIYNIYYTNYNIVIICNNICSTNYINIIFCKFR